MPCLLIVDVHERTNKRHTVPGINLLNLQGSEQSATSRREEKTLWSFTAASSCSIFMDAKHS